MHYRGRAGEDYRGGAGVLGAWGSGGGGGLGRQDTMRPENARGPRGRALDRAIRLPFEDIEHATREGKEDSGARLNPITESGKAAARKQDERACVWWRERSAPR
jgi:hypothetical protein